MKKTGQRYNTMYSSTPSPNGHVILFTGVPGAGKSSLVSSLACHISSSVIVSYGQILFEIVRINKKETTYEQMRGDPGRYISISDVKQADRAVARRVSQLRRSSIVFIELHPAVRDGSGFRVTPYSPQDIRVVAPDAIVHLVADYNTADKRLQDRSGNNLDFGEWAFEYLARLIEQAAVSYSCVTGCPLFLINAQESLDLLTLKVLSCLREIGICEVTT